MYDLYHFSSHKCHEDEVARGRTGAPQFKRDEGEIRFSGQWRTLEYFPAANQNRASHVNKKIWGEREQS
jgi:hypothetical protein